MVAGNLYKIPIRIEVEWGSATFRDTLHEHGVVLDMDANVTTIWSASFTRGTNWGKTIPYPTLHSMSGYIEWSSPHGEYNPSGVGTATGIIPREDLAKPSAVRILYMRRGETTWTQWGVGLLTSIEQSGQRARGVVESFHKAALNERVNLTELEGERFDGVNVNHLLASGEQNVSGSQFKGAALGVRDNPAPGSYILGGGLPREAARRSLVNEGAKFLAAIPYEDALGNVRYFEIGGYDDTAADFSFFQGSYLPITQQAWSNEGHRVTATKYDYGRVPLPGEYDTLIAEEEWTLGPGGSETRRYLKPTDSGYEANPNLTWKAGTAVARFAASVDRQSVPSGYTEPTHLFHAPVQNEDSFYAPATGPVQYVDATLAERDGDVVFTVAETDTEIIVTGTNTPSGAKRHLTRYTGALTRYRTGIGPPVNLSHSYGGSTSARVAHGSPLSSIPGKLFIEYTLRSARRTLEQIYSPIYSIISGISASLAVNYAVFQQTVGGYDYYHVSYTVTATGVGRITTVTSYLQAGTFYTTDTPQWDWKGTVQVSAKRLSGPFVGDQVTAPQEALDEYGIIPLARPSTWYKADPTGQGYDAPAKALVAFLSRDAVFYKVRHVAADLLVGQCILDAQPGKKGYISGKDEYGINMAFDASVMLSTLHYENYDVLTLTNTYYSIGDAGQVRTLYAVKGLTIIGDPIDSYIAPIDWTPPAQTAIAPREPRDFAVTAAGVASWGRPNDGGAAIASYGVEWRETGTETWSTATVNAPALTYTIAGLVSGTEYEARVRATNSAGDGQYTLPVTVTAA